MIGLEQMLLVNTGVCALALILLLVLSMNKGSRTKTTGKLLSKDMRKIKEEIAEE